MHAERVQYGTVGSISTSRTTMLHRNFISHVLAFVYDHYPYCIPGDTLVVQTSQQKFWYSHLESRVSRVIYDV